MNKSYGWQSDVAPHTEAYLADPILDVFRSYQVNRVLDLGAGNGSLCRFLLHHGFTPVGIERDADGVELAKSSDPTTEVYQADLETSAPDLISSLTPFDAVVSTEVIEHLYRPRALVQAAGTALSPGGILLISTPYHGYLKNLVLSILNKWDQHLDPFWDGGHIKFWSRATLERLLKEEGFSPTQFIGCGRLPFLWKSMLIVATKN